jgi:hypothetical protein
MSSPQSNSLYHSSIPQKASSESPKAEARKPKPESPHCSLAQNVASR